MHRKYLVLIIIVSLLIGYFTGVATTVKLVTDVAKNFIDVDYTTVSAALYQYKNNINNCYLKGGLDGNE